MKKSRYPEFDKLVSELVLQTVNKINADVPKIKSEMPYKHQYVLEEVIKRLEAMV